MVVHPPAANSETAFFLRWAREARIEGDDFEELRPGREDDVDGKGTHDVEEADARVGNGAGLAPERFGEVGNGVEREGEQVEDGEHGGEIGFAVAEIVFEVVAFGLEGVEGFVLDLPAGAAAGVPQAFRDEIVSN